MKALLFICCLVGALGLGAILTLLGLGDFKIEWPGAGHAESSYQDGYPAARSTPARYEMCSPEIGTASLIPEGSAPTYERLGWCYGSCPCPDTPVDPETVRKCRDGTYLGCEDGKAVCWDRPSSDGRAAPASSADLECFEPVPASGTRLNFVRTPNKYDVCHIPEGNILNVQSISVSLSAVSSHVDHGDCIGTCPCSNCLVIPDPNWVVCPLLSTRSDCLGPRCIAVSVNITLPSTNCSACPAPTVNCTSSCPVNPTPALNCTASCPAPTVNCSATCPPPPVPPVNCTASCPPSPATNVSVSYNYTICRENRRSWHKRDGGRYEDSEDCKNRPSYCIGFDEICALCPPVEEEPANCTALGCAECAADPSCTFCASSEYGEEGLCQFSANATDTCKRALSTAADIGECFSSPPPPPPVPCSNLDCLACALNPSCAFCANNTYGGVGSCMDIDHVGETYTCAREIAGVPAQCFVPAPANCTACLSGINCTEACPVVVPPVVCGVLDCDACQHTAGCQFCFDDAFGGAGTCLNATEAPGACARVSQGAPSTCYVPPETNCTESCPPPPTNCSVECPVEPTNCTAECPPAPTNCSALDCVSCNLDPACAFCASGPYGSAGTCQDASLDFSACSRTLTMDAEQCFASEPIPVNCSASCPPDPLNCSASCPPDPVDCSLSCPITPENCTNAFNCSTLCPIPPVDCPSLGCAECGIAPECGFCFDAEYGASGQCYAIADLPGGSCVRTAESSADECYREPPVICDNATSSCGELSSTNETFCAYLLPAVNCMQPDGANFVVFWGYYSSIPEVVGVPVGPENMFEAPSAADRGQPVLFEHGASSGVFTTLRAPGETQTWALGYSTYGVQGLATANDNTPMCSDCAAIDDCGSCAETVGCLWCDGQCVAGANDAPIDDAVSCTATNECDGCPSESMCGGCTLKPGCMWCNSSSQCVANDTPACAVAFDNVAQCPDVTIVLDPSDVETLREEVCCTNEPRGWVSGLVVLGLIAGLALMLLLLLVFVVLFTRKLRQNKDD